MAYTNASIYYGNPEASPLTSPASGWTGMSTAEKLYGIGTVLSGASNIASSIFGYKAAEEQYAASSRAARLQRDRTIREMTEAFIQQEAAEKVSLWESGLQYRGTAEAVEESNIKTRETQLRETRQYYDDMIRDLERAEQAAKGQAWMSGISAAVGTAATTAALFLI